MNVPRRRTAGLVALGLWAVTAAACGWRDVRATVTFRQAHGLREGQSLVYNGVRAGEITGVTLDPGGRALVRVRIPRRYRKTLYREADYSVGRPGGVFDTSGERQITVTDRPGPRTPLEDGVVIEGREPLLGLLLDGVRDAAAIAWDQTRELGRKLADEAAATEAGRRLKEAMRRLEDALARGEAALAPQIEGLRQYAEAYRDDLRSRGHEREAEEFWAEFERWYTRMRSLPTSPAPPAAVR